MLSEIVNILILATIQGLTEFLPVSSSGHLVLAGALLGGPGRASEGSLIFEVAVHIGTLGAIITIYRNRIISIIKALFSWIVSGFRVGERNRKELGYGGWILLGSLPAAAAGLLFRDQIVNLFDSPASTSVFLVLTGLFLLMSKGKSGESRLTWRIVLVIGFAQMVAILPGCSRSGWTITAALLAGIGFERAAEFSFMLSIPAILGALVLELVAGTDVFPAGEFFYLILGMAMAFVSGFLALKLLIYLLKKGSLYRFAYYLIPAGAMSFVYFVLIR